jgi:hypothetical protein
MFKAIKITQANAKAIEAALAAVNGRATAHTFTTFGEVQNMAATAEAKLNALSIPKAMRKDAVWSETSGAAVTNAYAKKSSTRAANWVRLERRSADWFLTNVGKTEIYKEGGGPGRLTLTKEQATKAVEVFSKQFAVAAPAAE